MKNLSKVIPVSSLKAIVIRKPTGLAQLPDTKHYGIKTCRNSKLTKKFIGQVGTGYGCR